jgi:hypothetical protein
LLSNARTRAAGTRNAAIAATLYVRGYVRGREGGGCVGFVGFAAFAAGAHAVAWSTNAGL